MKILAILSIVSVLASTTQARATAQSELRRASVPLPAVDDVKTPPPALLEISMPPFVGSHTARELDARKSGSALNVRAGANVANVTSTAHAPLARVLTMTAEEGKVWARGRQYKASFGPEGATYVPFFGSTAPANYPVVFATRTVRVGAQDLLCAGATPVLEGDSVIIARGGLTERWNLSLDGAEQQFVFASLPQGDDLVLTIDVATDLEPVVGQGSISFTNELGRVDYGSATAVDARGQQFAMTSTCTGRTIELRLDADSLARAQLPLVVDPIVSTFAINVSPADDYHPDVAYEAGTDLYLAVYEEIFSGTDHDVYAELRDATGAVVSSDTIDYTSDFWSRPRVASNRLAQNFLCVAAVGLPSSEHIIRGRTFSAVTGLMGYQFTIAGLDGHDKLVPDVGGDPSMVAPSYYCVVWQREWTAIDNDIHARMVRPDSTLVGTQTFPIDNTSLTLDTEPSISKSDGQEPSATQAWTIVWQRLPTSSSYGFILGAQVQRDGTILHAPYSILSFGYELAHPRVSSLLDPVGTTRPYMVTVQYITVSGDWNVDARVLNGSTFLASTDVASQVDPATYDEDQINPCVDSDGNHFTVVYSSRNPTTNGNFDLIAADLVFADDFPFVCDAATLASTTTSALDSAITSTYSGGGARQRFFAIWSDVELQTNATDLNAALYDGVEGGFTEPFCFGDGTATGCPCGNVGGPGNGCANSVDPNGANLTSTGNPQVSADTFVLQASGMPPGSSGLYFQGQPPAGGYYGAVFGDGIRCIATSLRRIGGEHAPQGSSQYPTVVEQPLSVAGMIPATGKEIFYQVWYRNAVPYCTTSTFNMTNGLRVVWAP